MFAPRELSDDEALSASWLNQFVAFVRSGMVRIAPDSGLAGSVGPNGTTIGLQATPDLWIKITYVGVSGSYSWIEQVPAASGNWTDGFRRGYTSADPARSAIPADPAWEANFNAALAVGYRSEASRDPAAGRLSFRAGHC